MRTFSEDRPDPARPALVVTYGNTPRKYRTLERDVVIVGRAPGCEVALASPEIAPVHCVLARGPHGWRVRDCTGRGATRVNGTAVVEGPLKDGDTLQIGSFSFEAHLPPSPNATTMAMSGGPPPPTLVAEPEAPLPDVNEVEARRLDIRALELKRFAEHLRKREEEVNARLAQRHEEVARAEATVREQRAELVRRMSDMARAGQPVRTKADSVNRQDAEALRAQLSMLRQELAGRDSIIASLRIRIDQMERNAPSREAVEHEHEELGRLREELQKKMEQAEFERAELTEATREAELQAARERAQLARDRAELERLLDEFRYEQQQARQTVAALVVPEVPVFAKTPRATEVSVPGAARGTGSHPAASKWRDFGRHDDEPE